MNRANLRQSGGRHYPWPRSKICFQRCLTTYRDHHFNTKPWSTWHIISVTYDGRKNTLKSLSISMTGI